MVRSAHSWYLAFIKHLLWWSIELLSGSKTGNCPFLCHEQATQLLFSMMWCSFLANQGVELLEQTNYCNIILCMYCAVTSLYVKFWLKSIRGMLKLHISTYHFAWSAHIHQCVVVVIGRRSCIGEGLARMKQFLIFSTIMQRYTVKLAECSQHVTDEPKQGLGLTPQDYKIIYTSRQQA